MNDTDRQLYQELVRRLAAMDRTQYETIADYHADLQNPLYGVDESYTELVERKLEASKHLYENSPHRVSDVRGGDSIAVRVNMDSGETKLSDPGDLGRSKVTDGSDRDPNEGPVVTNTGTSLQVSINSETFEGDGE